MQHTNPRIYLAIEKRQTRGPVLAVLFTLEGAVSMLRNQLYMDQPAYRMILSESRDSPIITSLSLYYISSSEEVMRPKNLSLESLSTWTNQLVVLLL
jgi:hypothetical protein